MKIKQILILTLLAFRISHAQSWQFVGSTSTTGITLGEVSDISLAFSQTGVPFIAYSDINLSNKTMVVSFNGTNWAALGSTTGISVTNTYGQSLAISPFGVPYVAYREQNNSNKPKILSFNNGIWSDVGGTVSGTGVIAISPTGVPYVAYTDYSNSNKASVRSFNGSNWGTVGGMAGISSGTALNSSLAFSPSGVPYLAYTDFDNGQKATVLSFNGSNWGIVGGVAGTSAGGTNNISIAISSSGTPYVAYGDVLNGQKTTVISFNGTNWGTVGGIAGISAGEATDQNIAISQSGVPYVSYRENLNGSFTKVLTFNGTNWGELVGLTDDNTSNPRLKINPITGEPFVAYKGSDGTIFVQKYSASTSCSNPTIVSHASNATVCSGLTHTFAPTVSGSNLTYAWSNGSSNPHLITSIAGTYTLTISSGICRVISQPRSLTIKQVPTSFNAIENNIMNCAGGFSSSNNPSSEFSVGSSSQLDDELNKFYRNGVFMYSFRGEYSPEIYANTFIGSDFIVTITSTIENSCATIAGTTYTFAKPTITSINIPSSVIVTLGGASPEIIATVLGTNNNFNNQWAYNGTTISLVFLNISNPSDRFINTSKNNPSFYITTVLGSDLTSNFVYRQKACSSHGFTESNPLRLTTVAQPSVPGTNVSATVLGLNTSSSLSNIVNAVLFSITGSGFVNGATVTIGGVIISNVVVSGNQITGTIPANSTIINPNNPTILVQNPGASVSVPVSPANVVVGTTFTNLPNYQSSNLSVYPNPSKGTFFIQSSEEFDINDIKIYDLIGTNQSFILKGNELTISKSGIYFVNIGGKVVKVVVL